MRAAATLVRDGAVRPLAEVVGGQLARGLAVAVLLVVGRDVLDALTAGSDGLELGEVVPLFILLAVALAVHGSVGVWIREARLLVSEHTVHHVHRRIINVTTSVDYESFEQPDFHDRLGRAREHATQHVYGLVYGLIAIIDGLIGLVIVSLVLLRIMPALLVGLVAVAVPLVAVALLVARLTYRVQYELTTDDRRRRHLQETLIGTAAAKEIRLFDLGTPLTDRWAALAGQRIDRMHGVRRTRMALAVAGNVLTSTIAVGALAFLAVRAGWGSISASDTAVAVVALQQVVSRMRSLADGIGNVRVNAYVLDDFAELLTLETEVGPGTVPFEALEKLEFSKVSFTYPGTERTVLDSIDLDLSPGRVVALVGANGSGKSTMAKLLSGLYAPTTGTIRWNGKPVVDQRRLTASVTAIHQEFVRHELTADENIATSELGAIDGSVPAGSALDRQITQASIRAEALDFLDGLPLGRSTVLSRSYDDGVELSGGQWQRVALARALFHDAPIVVLDEPTSALDALAERRLFETMRRSFSDRAVLLVSHRFSSVRDADEICVLDGGRIVERGTHDDLVSRRGTYAQLFRAQADAYVTQAD